MKKPRQSKNVIDTRGNVRVLADQYKQSRRDEWSPRKPTVDQNGTIAKQVRGSMDQVEKKRKRLSSSK